MKKILVILAIFFIFSSLSAQTYTEVKERNKKEQEMLMDRLEKINSRIYYLEDEVSGINTERKGLVYNNKKVKKDQKLKEEELDILKKQKANLLKALDELDAQYYTLTSKEINVNASGLPEQMGPVEYKRRGRSQAMRLAEGADVRTSETKEFSGILINNNRENASFKFIRTDIKENYNRVPIPVPANSEKEVTLPMGVYMCYVSCNGRDYCIEKTVDPRSSTEAGKYGKKVYFWVEKTRFH